MSSTWRDKEVTPLDFLEILYEQKEEEVSEAVYLKDDGQRKSPQPEAPPHSPLSPRKRPKRPRLRSPSRSPIRLSPESSKLGVALRIYNEERIPRVENAIGGDFFTPDAHPLFVSENEMRDSESSLSIRGRSVRRGRRSVRGIRGRGGRGRQDRVAHGHSNRWTVGDPLIEIYLNDTDVPLALISMVGDIMRNRGIGAQGGSENNEGDKDSDDEEYYDANDDTFEWRSMETFDCKEEVFREDRLGSVQSHNSAYDAFRSYWDDEVLNRIVSDANLYASSIQSKSFQSEWVPTNIHEILCLFAFWMMLGIIRMPTITSCFSLDPLIKTEVFRRIFTKTRYANLSRAIHFIDQGPNCDKLLYLRPIIEHLNNKFQNNYTLSKEICIYKGRLDMKQTKTEKNCIKTFELCESVTGYLWSFIVDNGKQSPDVGRTPAVLKSISIVKSLISPLLNKGYKLFMDSWYNSPKLARFLKRNGTDCVGPLPPNRSDVPVLINSAPLQRGEIISRHSGDMTVLAWQDMKRVTMISTCHSSSTGLPRVLSNKLSRPLPYKPQMVLDYNKFMGGVDANDQNLEPYVLERKRCRERYMKLFKRLLNASIQNSKTLLESSTNKNCDHFAFRLELVDSILTNHLSQCPQNRRLSASSSRSSHLEPGRIVQNAHWPTYIDDRVQGTKLRKLCALCLSKGKKNSKTTFCCENCKVPLCVPSCFKSYHTL